MRVAIPVFTLALATFVLAPPALAGDVIVTHKGTTLGNKSSKVPPTTDDFAGSTWTVLEKNLDLVRYRLEGVADLQSIKTSMVREVFHDPENVPGDLRAGLKKLEQLDGAGARASLAKVVKSRTAPPWARDKAAFEIAASYWYDGDAKAAKQALAEFKANHPKSALVGDATRIAARASLAMGKPGDALKEFEELKRVPGLPEAQVLEAEYYIATILEALAKVDPNNPDKAKVRKAKQAYMDLYNKLQTKPALSRTRGLCTVGIASCDILTGNADAAKPRLQKLIAAQKGAARDDLVLAGAYTRLGNVLMLENADANDRKVYKEALWHFLRVVTLYGEAQDADEYMAESLFRAGELFSVLRPASSADPKVKAERSEGKRRARREFNECIKRYGNSSWGRRARAAMNALK